VLEQRLAEVKALLASTDEVNVDHKTQMALTVLQFPSSLSECGPCSQRLADA
jgi:hypothetical protein